MSLKTLLAKIGSVFSNIFKSLKPNLKNAVHWGVVITEKLKEIIESPTADILTAIIPGNLDDKIKKKLREKIPNILIQLKMVEAAADKTDPDEIMEAALKIIQQLDGDYKSAFLHNFSILTAQVAADGKLDWSDAVYLLQWYYDNKAKNQPIPDPPAKEEKEK